MSDESAAIAPADWPADVDPQSGFRLPMLRREDLDEECKQRYDHAARGGNIAGLQGPTAIALYSPKTAGPRNVLSQYLRQEAGLGPRVREIALLVTSRSMDTQFEWTAHEPEAIKAGVPQNVIDVIKFHKNTQGLDPTDAVVIDLGRAVWKDHKVSAELFAKANNIFGPNKLVDLVLLMGSHATSGALLATFGMQLHKGKRPLLSNSVKARSRFSVLRTAAAAVWNDDRYRRRQPMIIDWHTHVYPPSEAEKPIWQGRCPMTTETVLAAQEQAGIDASVISNPLHFIRRAAPGEALAAVENSNRHLAEMQDRHRGRIIGFASTIPNGGDAHIKELERAIVRDGLKGVLINSSFQGSYPDDAEARPFFALASELQIPVMLHPPPVGFGEERMKQFRLASSIGRPFDSCLALARLILYGVLEQFPNLKLVASHLGGGICEMLGRLDYNYELQKDGFYTRVDDSEALLIQHPPSYYLKSIYFNSVSYHLPALQCALDTIGADRILFGTDAPPLTPLKQQGLDLIEALDLVAADKANVLAGNALRLLGLPQSSSMEAKKGIF